MSLVLKDDLDFMTILMSTQNEVRSSSVFKPEQCYKTRTDRQTGLKNYIICEYSLLPKYWKKEQTTQQVLQGQHSSHKTVNELDILVHP